MHIAILGWGSLLWDQRPEFDDHHGLWELDGPNLKIEFSRISQTRGGALTLVIDPTNGTRCRVAHTKSKRHGLEWRLLPDQLAFIPGFPTLSGFHDRLLRC